MVRSASPTSMPNASSISRKSLSVPGNRARAPTIRPPAQASARTLHSAQYLAQFLRRSRGLLATHSRRPPGPRPQPVWIRLPGRLPVRIHRNRINPNKAVGNHEAGQKRCAATPDRCQVEFRPVCRNDIGDQHRCARPSGSLRNDRIPNGFMALDGGFHFTRLDPETPDLNLAVHASEIFDFAVRQPAREIPGTIKPSVSSREWIPNEFLGREIRSAEISSCEGNTADTQFARHANRNLVQIAIQEPDRDIRHRPTKRNRRPAITGPESCTRYGYCRFGWSIEMDHLRGITGAESLLQLDRQRLAAAHHVPEPLDSGCLVLKEVIQHCGNKMDDCDALLLDHLVQIARFSVSTWARDDQAGARHQRPKDLFHRNIEAKGAFRSNESVGESGQQSCIQSRLLLIARCSATIPFGDQVEPDV